MLDDLHGEVRAKFVRQLDAYERMSRHLAIDYHPFHLDRDEIVRPRGFGTRNAQAVQAVRDLVPAAAARALDRAGITAHDVDALLVTSSTAVAMPSLAAVVAADLGLRADADQIPLAGMGCIGGGHAIGRACEYVRAWPDRTLLVVAADVASPWFFVERERRGTSLRGSVVSASLFSDGVAAAVMSMPDRAEGDGFEILDTASISVPDTADAIAWEVRDDGLHFTLTDRGLKSIPGVAPALQGLMTRQGWVPEDLAPAALHTGGNRIIDDVQKHLALSDWHMGPTRKSLRKGNTMSVAVLDALTIIANDDEFRPSHGMPGIGAGYGPGFAAAGFSWTFHDGH